MPRPKSLWAAVGILTSLPVPGRDTHSPATLVGGLIWFPIVGVLIGALAAGAELAVRGATGLQALSCAAALALGLLVTGERPLRGLMQMAGALFSGRSPEALAELAGRRSPTAFGVLVALGAILMRYALLLAAPGAVRPWAIVVAGGLSRSAVNWVFWRFPYARADTGIAGYLAELAGPRDLLLALPVLALAFGALGPLSAATMVAGTWLVGHMFAVWVSHLLGGLTAQTCEAIIEVAELAALAGAAAIAALAQT